jgi:hypothetical protein
MILCQSAGMPLFVAALSPREMARYQGELAWPERFDRERDRNNEYELGSIAHSGQYQQSPVPRKGGIIKREYWQDYIVPPSGRIPDIRCQGHRRLHRSELRQRIYLAHDRLREDAHLLQGLDAPQDKREHPQVPLRRRP